MNELRLHFRPEFLNRLDELILFTPLTSDHIGKIVELLLSDLRKRLEDRHLNLELTEKAKRYIVEEGYDPVFGARPLKRFLQRNVETLIAKALIAGEILDGARLIIDHNQQGLNLVYENPLEKEELI